MTVEEITSAAEKIQCVNIGGTDVSDIFAMAGVIQQVHDGGKVPMIVLFPTDVYFTLFDDGEFRENSEKFMEIQAKHTKAMLEEYAAWKVLQTRAAKIKK